MEEFDESAVNEHLKERKQSQIESVPVLACGCPSSQIQTFKQSRDHLKEDRPEVQGDLKSVLSHWPIKIRPVPPTAPFLKGADLLVVADCVPVAHPNFHQQFLSGKAVLDWGCPKFDDTGEYIQKFTEIFRAANVRSITVLDMEVPCCSALPMIVRKGMAAAGKEIPIQEIVIGRRGNIITREKSAA